MKESQCKQAAYFKKGGCTVVTDSLADLPAHVPVIPVSADNIEQIPHIINRIGYYLTLTGQNAAGNRMVPSSGTVAKLAMRQPFVLFKGLTFQKLCLPGAFRPGD
ncbi:hypothetical protein ACRWD3_13800, partial [Escherichia coli]